MKIYTKTNAISDFQIKKKIATSTAREELETKLKQEKNKATNKFYKDRGYDADASKNYQNLERNYNNIRPESLDSATTNKMWKEAKRLKDKFTIGMLSKDELHPVKQFEVNGTIKTVVDYERLQQSNAVKREAAWLEKNQKDIKKFKNIMRHLDPENPNAGNIERFRPMRRGRK